MSRRVFISLGRAVGRCKLDCGNTAEAIVVAGEDPVIPNGVRAGEKNPR
jgi:hypothetical protein